MDEAERCHNLAILDRGVLVAAGSPRELIRDIPAGVIEIETDRPQAARRCLEDTRGVESVAQLGTRLHALTDPDLDDPATLIRDALQDAGIGSEVEAVTANLEDVFVATTRLNNQHRNRADAA
jgi:ABC-2 type transport system ATP-binding protein